MLPSRLIKRNNSKTSNHLALYTAALAAAAPKSFSIKVAAAVEKIITRSRKAIHGVENKKSNTFFICLFLKIKSASVIQEAVNWKSIQIPIKICFEDVKINKESNIG